MFLNNTVKPRAPEVSVRSLARGLAACRGHAHRCSLIMMLLQCLVIVLCCAAKASVSSPRRKWKRALCARFTNARLHTAAHRFLRPLCTSQTVFGGSARSPLEPRARSPGPAAYMVPDALGLQAASTKISAPRPVFGKGGRESPLRSQTGTLGAGAYDLPPVLGHSFVSQSPPAYSLRPRSYSPDAIPGRYSPGPAVYDVPSTIGATVEGSKPCPPSFTMRPRTTLVGPKPIKPGPGEYSPNTSQTLMAAPSFSLRSRHDLPVRFAHADGPAAYDISGVMSVGTRTVVGHKPSSPAFSLRPRTRDIAESVRERQPSPSPGTSHSHCLLAHLLPPLLLTTCVPNILAHVVQAITMRPQPLA